MSKTKNAGYLTVLLLAALLAAAAAQSAGVQLVRRPVQKKQRTTNCRSLGSGCRTCSYHRGSRGLLSTDPTTTPTDASATEAALPPTTSFTHRRRGPSSSSGSSSGPFSYGGAGGFPIGGSSGGWGSSSGGWGSSSGWTSSSSGGGGSSSGWTSSSSGGTSSGGGGGGGWQFNCDVCNAAGYYQLRSWNDGIQRCGCSDKYGLVAKTTLSTTTAWQRGWVDVFNCQPCPDGYVPFGPSSNLMPYYDAASRTWQVKLNRTSAAAAVARGAKRASVTGTRIAVRPASLQQQSSFFTQSSTTVAGCGCDMPPPWYPYECVPCPDGYSVDFYGLACVPDVCTDPAICGGTSSSSGGSSSGGSSSGGSSSGISSSGGSSSGSSSSSSGGSSSGSTTSSSSSSSSSGGSTTSSSGGSTTSSSGGSSSGGGTGACVLCTPTLLETMIGTTCAANPQATFYLSDDCAWSDPMISQPLFSTDPDILFDPASGADVGDCIKAANYKGQQVTITYTINSADTGVTCSPTTGTYVITIPNF